MSREVDCLIIGGGPSGLTLGIGLIKIGKSVMIVDKLEIHQPVSKAVIVDQGTLQALQEFGISDKLNELGIALDGLTYSFCGEELLRLSFHFSAGLSLRHPVVLPLKATEDCLSHAFTQLGGQLIKGAVFEPDVNHILKYVANEQMDIVLNYDGVRFPVRCSWLFGCDGLHSAVRNALLIECHGATENEDRYVIDATIQHWPYAANACYFFFGFSDTRCVMQLLPDPLTVRVITPNKATCEIMLQYCGVNQILFSGRFSHSYRVAESFGRDRIWLVGDAAAVFSPIGSRGHNWGMLDAMALVRAIRQGDVRNYEKQRRRLAWACAFVEFTVSQVLMSRRWYCVALRFALLALIVCIRRLLGENRFAWLFRRLTSMQLLTNSVTSAV